MMNAAYVMVTTLVVLIVRMYQMVTAGKVTVAALLQITPGLTVTIDLANQMELTMIRAVGVEYMMNYQQMAVMKHVVLL